MVKRFIHSNIGAAVLNMLVAYLVWMLSRVAFFAENWSSFAPYMSWSLFKSMLHGALVFDTCRVSQGAEMVVCCHQCCGHSDEPDGCGLFPIYGPPLDGVGVFRVCQRG